MGGGDQYYVLLLANSLTTRRDVFPEQYIDCCWPEPILSGTPGYHLYTSCNFPGFTWYDHHIWGIHWVVLCLLLRVWHMLITTGLRIIMRTLQHRIQGNNINGKSKIHVLVQVKQQYFKPMRAITTPLSNWYLLIIADLAGLFYHQKFINIKKYC